MKKIIPLIFFAVLLFANVFALNQTGYDIAYITKGTNYIDNNIVNAINEIGFTIEYIDDSNIQTTNFSKYRMILVPDERFDSYVPYIPVNEVKTLSLNTYHMDEWNWITNSVSQTGSSQALGANVVDSTSKITEGIPLNFKVYTQAQDNGISIPLSFLSKSRKAVEIKGVVSTEDDYLDAVIAKTEIGTKLKNNKVANARGVFFGITETEFWTADSKKLFKNSILWLVSGEDRDADGFFTDEDCNDNNASINPGELEIPYDGIDQDCDGVDLKDIDSDGYLGIPAGGNDCDDTDATINPGSLDSAKNCVNEAPIFSGPISNLIWNEDSKSGIINLRTYFADVDGDVLNFQIYNTSEDKNITMIFLTSELIRFESAQNWHGSDWVIISASDGELTTLSNNITLIVNSIGDAPVLQQVNELIVNENDLIELTLNATDGDRDELTYSMSDERFVYVGNNTYEWQTTYEDAGVYEIEATVTDGEFNDSQIVKITINNLNRPPVVEEIPNQIFEEDNSKSILVTASDPDNDILIYQINSENINKVNCELNGNNITLTPYENWNGETSCELKIMDGKTEIFKSFAITVLPVNDAPVLQNINNLTINENDFAKIVLNATDGDRDELTYSMSDERFVYVGNNTYEWQTTYEDAGVYEIEATVTDGEFNDSQIVKITIANKNEPPHMNSIDNITIEEDSGLNLIENVLSAIDSDGEISKFKIIQEDKNKVDCEISGTGFGVTPAKDFEGEAYCTIRAYDDFLDYDETIVRIIVNNINDKPKIISYSPGFNPLIAENENYNFNIEWVDIDTPAKDIVVKWYVNDVLESIGNEFTFMGDGTLGEFDVKVIVKDDFGETASKEWTIIVTNVPVADSFDGQTTDFSSMTETQLSSVNLVLEKTSYGKIEFLESVDLREIPDFDNYIKILNGVVGIDSAIYPEFKNKEAKITLYNIYSEKTPAVYYSNEFNLEGNKITQVCPDSICSNIGYADNKLSFVVTGFSTFIVGDTLTCSQQEGNICGESEVCSGNLLVARDSNSCCSGECTPSFDDAKSCEIINNKVGLELKDPDNNDDFEIGETIPIKLKIKNNFDDKINFDVNAYLYDLDEDGSVYDIQNKIKVPEGNSETIELEIEIPKDIEDHSFAVFVIAEDRDDESVCNQVYANIKINRKDHDIIVKDIGITPLSISSASAINVEVKIENLGSKDEDAYVLLENSELGISKKSDEFEIESFGDDDKEKINFEINLPENLSEKEYALTATVVYDGGDEENSLSQSFVVANSSEMSKLSSDNSVSSGVISLNKKTPSDIEELSENKIINLDSDKREEITSEVKINSSRIGIVYWLIFGIIILITLISIVNITNKK